MRRCKHPHPPIDAFIASRLKGSNRIVWRCSHCGKEDVWGPSWSYYGAHECQCGATGASAVVCSDECRDAFKPSDPALALEFAAKGRGLR